MKGLGGGRMDVINNATVWISAIAGEAADANHGAGSA